MRKIFALISGSIIGQAVTLASFPFITRAYDAQSFGEFQVFIGFCNAFGLVSALSFERALYVTQDGQQRSEIETICYSLVFGMSVLSSLIYPLFVVAVPGAPVSAMGVSISVFVFFCTLTRGLNLVLYARAITESRIKSASLSSLMRDLGRQFSRLGLAYGSLAAVGLYLSSIFDWIAGCLTLIVFKGRPRFVRLPWRKASMLFRMHWEYIVFLAPVALLGMFVSQLPIFLISGLYSAMDAGLYSAGFIMISRPSRIFATAAGEIFSSQVGRGQALKAGTSNEQWLQTKQHFMIVLCFELVFLGIIGAAMYLGAGLLLGESWIKAGPLVVASIPYVFSLVVDEMSIGVFSVSGNNRILSIKLFLLAGGMVLFFYIAKAMGFSVFIAVLSSGLYSCLVQFLFLFLLSARIDKRQLVD